MASAVLGKYASIAVVDLIPARNWIPRIFINLVEARFDSNDCNSKDFKIFIHYMLT